MKTSLSQVPATSVRPLTEPQRRALISLLADEDPAVFATVRERLLDQGLVAADWLKPYLLSDHPLLRRRARDISDHLGRVAADAEFNAFILNHGEHFDLERGVFLLARTQYPQLNLAAYAALLDSFADDLRPRLAGVTDHFALLGTINDYLFKEKGFHGNEATYYAPDNSYLNKVVDLRTGNPISLCTVYLFVGRRLKLPVVGIGFPWHFMCRYQTPTCELYIDPFAQGRLLTKADCIKSLVQMAQGWADGFLAPSTPRRMLLRMCANLHQIYHGLDMTEEGARFHRYVVALAK